MSAVNFETKKKFGQNFLTDKNLLAAIVKDAGVEKCDNVIEIGPGAGALSCELCKCAKSVVCYEIDKQLEPILDEALKEFDNVEVVFKDILKVDISEIENRFSSYKVVANLPYYITTPIIFKFLEEATKCQSITIMVQKEVAQKMVAKRSDVNYGVLSVMTNFLTNAKIMRMVNRSMFHPAPKVDSCVIRLDVKHEHDKGFEKKVKDVVFACFGMRRKTLSNNLTMALKLPREEINRRLAEIEIAPTVRAENLTIEDFVKIAKAF